MTENTPLIIPELVSLDADAGPGKEDVIEFLAATVAGAGRASSPDGLAADAKKRESTAPTGIPGGIAIPHCRSAHVLTPSLGFARLAEPGDFGAADGQAADLVFMIAAPDGADDFHLQLLAGHFGIRSIPTLMVFRERVIVFQQAGALPKGALDDLIRQIRNLDMEEIKRGAQPYSADNQ